MKIYHSKNTAETENIAAEVAKQLKSGDLIAMFGSMGMGKTAFVRGLCTALEFKGEVSSPTFAIVHEYNGGRLNIYHFDMYRVESFDDLYSTGFFEYMDMGGVVAIEWSENIEGALPEKYIRIEFQMGENENDRIIKIEGL